MWLNQRASTLFTVSIAIFQRATRTAPAIAIPCFLILPACAAMAITEPYHTENLSNGIRVYFGSSSYALPSGTHSYQFAYSTNRQLGFFHDHDELYWNVTGNALEVSHRYSHRHGIAAGKCPQCGDEPERLYRLSRRKRSRPTQPAKTMTATLRFVLKISRRNRG